MANTTNYNFEKPAQTDYYDVEVQNNNWDKLDTELKKTNDNKQDTLVSGVSIKTINGESLLGTGNIFIKGGTSSDEVTARKADVLKGKTTITNDSADEIVAGTLEVQSIVNFNLSLYASETVMGAWQKPAKGPYSGVRVIYRTDRYPNNPDDGTLAYEGSDISFTRKLPAGTKHYFAAYSYMTTNFGRIYNEVPVKAEFTPSKIQGRQVFKSNGTFTVPNGVYSIQVFVVGGGGSGGGNKFTSSTRDACGGGGGGYTNTQSISVTPGQNLNVIIGNGGAGVQNGCGLNGGTSQIGSVSAAGGAGGINRYIYPNKMPNGGAGGSGGGGGSHQSSAEKYTNKGGAGGSNGGNGSRGVRYNDYQQQYATYSDGGVGQGRTTREFDQSGATPYAGGGGGGGADNADGGAGGSGGGGRGSAGGYSRPNSYPSPGSANTGGGGGGGGGSHSSHGSSGSPGAAGGSGIVIVRWGY